MQNWEISHHTYGGILQTCVMNIYLFNMDTVIFGAFFLSHDFSTE